jgi:glycerate 2-kinase
MMNARISIQTSNARIKRVLKALIHSGLQAAAPDRAMEHLIAVNGERLFVDNIRYDLSTIKRVVCVGAGKASAHMALALEGLLKDRLEGGLVIVKDGYRAATTRIQTIEAGHPLPDRRGIRATQQVLTLARSLTNQDLLIVLLSGGASSLLCAPAPGLTLRDKQRTTRMLLQSGAPIQELNTVRKHLSAIKGGQLARATPAQLLTFILSDVIGDDLAIIGSGPTVPDPTTFREAQRILEQYSLLTKVPPHVLQHLEQGRRGQIPETVKARERISTRSQHVILANNRVALEAVAAEARRLGLKPYILTTSLQGEAKEIGSILGDMAKDLYEFRNPGHQPACLIAGGEPTVTVTGKGKGGRAQECVLAAAEGVAGLRNVFVAGFGTDGTDGPTNAAGAVVDGQTVDRARRMELHLPNMLAAHNSYAFFTQVGGHIITGPTRTNVNDIYLIMAF